MDLKHPPVELELLHDGVGTEVVGDVYLLLARDGGNEEDEGVLDGFTLVSVVGGGRLSAWVAPLSV